MYCGAAGGTVPSAGTWVFDTIARNGYKRVQMPLFAMGMFGMVLADNFLWLFIFWEIM